MLLLYVLFVVMFVAGFATARAFPPPCPTCGEED